MKANQEMKNEFIYQKTVYYSEASSSKGYENATKEKIKN